MILAVAATEIEMGAYLHAGAKGSAELLVTGVGMLESCLNLCRYLEKHGDMISSVLNFGIAGAYFSDQQDMPNLLDLCIANQEVLGDFGICFPRRQDDLSAELAGDTIFSLDSTLAGRAQEVAKARGWTTYRGNFVTVNSVSGTRDRGEILQQKYGGLCENMEGAAIARVCQEFSLPLLEIRCISNYVEDRDPSRWRIEEACEKAGEMAAAVVEDLEE